MHRHDPAAVEALAKKFMPRLSAGPGALESLGAGGSPEAAVADRWGRSREFLLRFIRDELGGNADLAALAERVLADGREGLELIEGSRDRTVAARPRLEAGLEVIVETDGSRPVFLIRDDAIVPDSSPACDWAARLTDVALEDAVRAVIRAVGRIDITHPSAPFAGTGWLIAPDLVATNRHVAQLFVDFGAPGGPRIDPARAPRIDFGHEFGGRDSVDPRPLTDLVFCGARPVPAHGIDHAVLDLAIFRAAPSGSARQPAPLGIGSGEALTRPETEVFLAGYPAASPREDILGDVTETDRVLRLLFGRLWGFKRLAPGAVMPSPKGRTMLHDATTLGGNSGSLVMGFDTCPAVTGIHYGGSWGAVRANWAHPLAAILDEEGLRGLRYPSLGGLCRAEGIELVEFP